MYKIKEKPDDFIVKEIAEIKIQSRGKYLVCLLKKTNYTTIRAIEEIARTLRIPIKNIGFAGIKDKNAITEQYISIKGTTTTKILKLNLKDIKIMFIGYSNEPISLGELLGNEFIITIRTLTHSQIEKFESTSNLMPNYFGPQRFSKNNVEIGRAIIQSDYEGAIELITKSNSDYSEKIKIFLDNNPKNYASALSIIPLRLLKLYVHAYQSYLWNHTLNKYLSMNQENAKIPLIGFGTEIYNKSIMKIISDIMQKEKIEFRNFINRKNPSLSLEGNHRLALVEIKKFKILEKEKSKIKISFTLPKGSYATVAIDFLLDNLNGLF